MKIVWYTLILIGLLNSGCGNKSSEKSFEKTDSLNKEENQKSNEDANISLNNGQRWKVDNDMLVHIRNMESNIAKFDGKTVSDYHLLAQKLILDIDLLTSNCTMEGKSHDELHKWLLPYIDLVNEFSECKNEKEGSGYLNKLKKSLFTFNQYFN